MKKVVLAGLMLASLIFGAVAQAKEVGRVVYAFTGELGAIVWTTRYDVPAANQALVQVTFVDSDLNDKILLAKVEETEKDRRYIVQINNQPFTLLVQQKDALELFLPNTKGSLRLGYDFGLSRDGNPQAFLSAYEAQ